MAEIIQTNKYQMPITDELLDSLPTEVKDNFLDAINSIEFIKRLISSNRQYAKDLPRDTKNRIIVDICNPHILEDMEYFRPTGNHYREHGVITKLRPNANPNSEFGKWIKEELNRIWNGMIRPSDGEWVTGNMYFYLNYTPIIQTKIIEGTKQGNRIVDFPEIWEGVYLMFHYIEQARRGGLYDNFEGGKHVVEIAKRGASKSYMLASIFAKLFICGENEISNKSVRGVVTAYQKESLIKDGTLNKFIDVIDFCAEHTQFPSRRLQDSLGEMTWVMGYKDLTTGANKGTGNEMLGVTAKDNVEKSRGKRCNVFGYEEFGAFKNFIDIWMVNLPSVEEGDYSFGMNVAIGCVCADSIVYDKYGIDYLIQDVSKDKGIIGYKENKANIEEITYIQKKTYKECLHIETVHSSIKCSIDHPILVKRYRNRRVCDYKIANKRECWQEQLFVPSTEIKKWYTIGIIDKINVWKNDILEDAYLVGALIGDGSYGEAKELPNNYKYLNKENTIQLLAGLFDTDRCVCSSRISITQRSEVLCKQIIFLLRKLGIFGTFSKIKSSKFSTYKDRTSDRFLYKIEIADHRSVYNFATQIPLKIKYKQSLLDKFIVENIKDYSENIRWDRIKNITNIGVQRIYNLTANDSHTYLVNNIITHNTGGSKGADFSGALEIIYSPKGYHVYALPNIFDRNAQGKQLTVFFFGAYLNRKGHYNSDGTSDIVGALLAILKARYNLKYNSSDPTVVTRFIAENPITIQEAIMKRDSTIFPVGDLGERLHQLDQNPSEYEDVYIGELVIKDEEVKFTPTTDIPIRDFPHKNNKLEGAIEIFKMPERDAKGVVFSNRYIASVDPYDDDAADTLSLGGTFILDLWTDEIVAEYTGRPMFADEYYEKVRRLLIFYNARCNYENNKKGLFTYFSKMNSLYLLTDTLEYLKDKDMIKGELYGNKIKGTSATAAINGYGRTLIRNWLLKPMPIIKKSDTEEGLIETTVPLLYKLRSRALIKELMLWNIDGNYDRVSSMIMLMLLREERMILCGGDVTNTQIDNDKDDLSNDEYFTRNYRSSNMNNSEI